MAAYQVVCFGELLWDVLPTGAKPGGAPMNVAYHLQKLGLPTAVITRVGNDEKGAELVRILSTNGLADNYVQTDTNHSTGVVLASLNEKAEATYEIVQPVAWDFIACETGLQDLVVATEYFIYGSLASRNETSRNTLFQLLESARTKVLDINLRPPHFTKAGVEALLQQCNILKINDQELQQISGWYGNLNKLEDQMRLLQDRFNIITMVTTRGSEGAVLIKDGLTVVHPGFKVAVKDTVGSGDAFLAALLFQLHKHTSSAEALAFANALGAYIASCNGACPAYDVSVITTNMQEGFTALV
jgi:fructokinase